MPKIIDEDVNNLKEKLDFIGLNLERIPKFISNFEPLDFIISNSYNDNEHRIFKYIPINEIEILISPTNRLNDIKEKYSLAQPLGNYLNKKNAEEYATFLKMLNLVTQEEIEKTEEIQKLFDKDIPFSIQYDKDYTWQIYYSKSSHKYFMLVTSEDYEFGSFFYVLKEQLKYFRSRKKIEKKIYVPVNYIDYSEDFITKSEIADLENYLWLFTKNWPNIYEVYDKENNMTLNIIGTTHIFKSLNSGYKVQLKNKEDAIKYYKGLKALFILQTELDFHYKFETKINENCELELYYGFEKINYENIVEFINKEYEKVEKQIEQYKLDSGELEKKLEELKQISAVKDLEYINKQKEIAMYLEYKKTFFGKIKLFLKFKKKKEIKNNIQVSGKKEIEENKENENKEHPTNNKEKHTIEDLIILYTKLEKETEYIKNMKSDIHALDLKIKNIDKKIENAKKYIDEIENHKKSIFEFWKFVNKDELLAMEEGNAKDDNTTSNLKRIFDYELDFTELGIQMDKLQRKNFTKETQDSIFLLDSEIIDCINMVKSNIDIDYNILRDKLLNLKELAEKKKILYNAEEFDIFGSISDSQNKVKMLANKKHRETEKDVLNILNIGKNTDVEEFKARIENAEKMISTAIEKVKASYDMPVYIAVPNTEMINKEGYGIFHIVPETALKESNKLLQNKINLYKLNILEGMPLIYLSNIIYYNNFNETLPLGMNVSDKIVIDASKFDFIPKDMTTFNICDNLTEHITQKMPQIKTIMLCEYELVLKNEEGEKKND